MYVHGNDGYIRDKLYLKNQLHYWCLSVAPCVALVTNLWLRSPMLTRQFIGMGRQVYSI